MGQVDNQAIAMVEDYINKGLDHTDLGDFLGQLGIVPDARNKRHLAVLLAAMMVSNERRDQWADTWRSTGFRGLLVLMDNKFQRMMSAFWAGHSEPGPNALDSPIDLINYATFFVQCYLDGNELGERWQ